MIDNDTKRVDHQPAGRDLEELTSRPPTPENLTMFEERYIAAMVLSLVGAYQKNRQQKGPGALVINLRRWPKGWRRQPVYQTFEELWHRLPLEENEQELIKTCASPFILCCFLRPGQRTHRLYQIGTEA